ncbi:hypothetical protein VOLCADRAFT_90360 [Volvox carteri f. nagariensis]|uniref:Phospholipase B-like n=1 Tax=Volvox carteri f. nagariensis TaxID=3068 RepID=D8TU60_VOLCA|nr:uncharacterized protein VOLCADRAFT_90360 [Volvox carteri f. nagariensis]EFJ48982.1 hypothetical protein VOLCADRAFT_90360 [Volvox carteri f. nagariensis]|eukprot:XP_002949879.1 hypothetical protein VOLCADRAFT_90360 [Volvox carteri f. nagariensis]
MPPGVCQCLFVVLFALSIFPAADAAAWGRLSNIGAWLKPSLRQAPELLQGYVKYNDNTGAMSFVKGLAIPRRDEAPAHGSFSDPLRHKSNFGQLRITTNPAFLDEIQMQAAGFLEGYLTAERIFDYAYNMKSWLASQTNDTFKVGDWLFEQDRWARQQVKAYTESNIDSKNTATASAGTTAPPPPNPSYWRAVGLLIAQADGLLAGYSARLAELGPQAPLERLTKYDFLMLNALGDMDDLLEIIFPSTDDGSDTSDYDDNASLVLKSRNGDIHGISNSERDASFLLFSNLLATSSSTSAAEAGELQHREGVKEVKEEEEGGLAVAAPGGRGNSSTWRDLTPGQVRARIAMRGRCTALVKVTPGLDDLLLGHVTWWSYLSMLRIYKHYNLGLTQLSGPSGGPVNTRVSFSSYPGQISSADDWYMLGNGLVVTETSLDTYDRNRYNASYGCTTSSLLSWQRVLAANLLAVDGPSWAELAASYNGGTYNNQYLIVNLNLFTPGSELKPGLLTISEIIPGLVMTADATDDLLLGHFPSYNVPYFREVYEAAGYRRHAEAMAARGAAFAAAAQGISYQLAPRAKIFRRDAADAADLDSFRHLLRSNGWNRRTANSDPLSAASPWDALCARGDLDPDSPALYGCYDGKVTNYRRALELSADAINGPTTENGQLPFRWDTHSGGARRIKYRGMLDVYDTEWEEQRP